MKAEQPRSIFQRFRQYRFRILLVTLFLLFFYGPILSVIAPSIREVATAITVTSMLILLLVASVYAVAGAGKLGRIVAFLAIPAIISESLDAWLLRDETQILSHTICIFFLLSVIISMLIFIFRSKSITSETIFAALCVFLLVAAVFTFAYSLLEFFEPGAFAYSILEMPSERIMRLGAEPAGVEFYYSLVTQTTLGFGDIVPITAAARSLTSMQAVIGQLYLAVLVARLVGMHVAMSMRDYDGNRGDSTKT